MKPQNYIVEHPVTGKRITLQGTSPPTEQDIDMAFAKYTAMNRPKPVRMTGSQQLARKTGPLNALAVSAGKGLYDIGRGLGLAKPADAFEKQAYRDLKTEKPIVSTIGEVAGQSAPFLLPGTAITALPKIAHRVLAATGLGAAEGGTIIRGQGGTSEQQLKGAGIGGAVAGTIELVLPRLIRIGSQLVRKTLGRAPTEAVVNAQGEPSQEFLTALRSEGLDFEDIAEEQIRALTGQPVDAKQAARKSYLESRGLQPTKAEVTRDAADFQAQQELVKTSGPVRQRIEANEAILSDQFKKAVIGTGGEAGLPTSTVTDVVVSKSKALDDRISTLYQQAREQAPGAKNVSLSELTAYLKRTAGSNQATDGAIAAVVGDLKSRGILSGRGWNLTGRVDVETAEKSRVLMNSLWDDQKPFRKIVLREMKDALDNDVFRAAGQDIFKEGRKAKAKFHSDLARAKVSKFDTRKQNLVQDILENRINPDEIVDKVVFSRAWRKEDLRQLKDYISTTPEGKAAWDDLQADTLERIRDKAFFGPEDASGYKAITRASVDRALRNLPTSKRNVLFDSDINEFLRHLEKISKMREPVRHTQIGKGPTAQAVSGLMDRVQKSHILRSVIDLVATEYKGHVTLAAKPAQIQQPLTRLPSQAAAGIGVATGAQMQENNGTN